MSDFPTRKKSFVSADPSAASKKLDETMEKLASMRAEREDQTAKVLFPSVSKEEQDKQAANNENDMLQSEWKIKKEFW